MIKAVIVDDEILSRIGIQSFIDGKEEIQVCGIFESAEDAIPFLRENHMDILITDIEMADMSGLDLIKVVKDEDLANGVIIISCHDDFSYAQKAIANGTDSYLLKHSLTENLILEEVKKVYTKTKKSEAASKPSGLYREAEQRIEEGIYVVGIVRIDTESLKASERQFDGTMLVHLLDGILSKYHMGTLFTPYNKEAFILFTFPPSSKDAYVRTELEKNKELLASNLKQYLNSDITFGFSTVFEDYTQMREKYSEALSAAEMSFYGAGSSSYQYREQVKQQEKISFSANHLLEKEGIDLFRKELEDYLFQSRHAHISVEQLREQLNRGITLLVYQVVKDFHLSESSPEDWGTEAKAASAIYDTKKQKDLTDQLIKVMEEFRDRVKMTLNEDELSAVFSYIADNLDGKLSLPELSDVAGMSVPSFSKKFKEKTGMTAVDYINHRRIDAAKSLLANQSNSLAHVAEKTGFSNENYLVRVFKKMTGMTVSDYRKQYDIE